MLQTYSTETEALYEGGAQTYGLGHYLDIAKRRAFYFLLPFAAILLLGTAITWIQRPIYEAKGKILVESQEIPTDLVRPTVMETANERIQVIRQRIMTRDNLLALMSKYGMFARERQWMSTTELLDLMRENTKFELVDINPNAGPRDVQTIAFTVSFEYGDPEVTQKVTNELLTLILSEDARNRTNRATETTNFLTIESQRLQGELSAIEAEIAQNKSRSQDVTAAALDPSKIQLADLTRLKEELAQKSSIYSAEHPALKALRKKVAAMEKLVAQAPTADEAKVSSALVELERHAIATEKNLADTNKKLEEARLGEKLERDQRSERLQVIEQPILPQTPIKPKRMKLFAASFALAMIAGAGVVFAAERFDGSVRHRYQLSRVTNELQIVSIPYIATRKERRRRKARLIAVLGIIAFLILAGVVGYLSFGPPVDLAWLRQFVVDHLTHLSK